MTDFLGDVLSTTIGFLIVFRSEEFLADIDLFTWAGLPDAIFSARSLLMSRPDLLVNEWIGESLMQSERLKNLRIG